MLHNCHSNLSLDLLVMWPAFYKSKRYELNIIELFIQPQTAMAKSLSKTPILIDFAKNPTTTSHPCQQN
jgi:hypothetical protein